MQVRRQCIEYFRDWFNPNNEQPMFFIELSLLSGIGADMNNALTLLSSTFVESYDCSASLTR